MFYARITLNLCRSTVHKNEMYTLFYFIFFDFVLAEISTIVWLFKNSFFFYREENPENFRKLPQRTCTRDSVQLVPSYVPTSPPVSPEYTPVFPEYTPVFPANTPVSPTNTQAPPEYSPVSLECLTVLQPVPKVIPVVRGIICSHTVKMTSWGFPNPTHIGHKWGHSQRDWVYSQGVSTQSKGEYTVKGWVHSQRGSTQSKGEYTVKGWVYGQWRHNMYQYIPPKYT